jgi:hypothetical protein
MFVFDCWLVKSLNKKSSEFGKGCGDDDSDHDLNFDEMSETDVKYSQLGSFNASVNEYGGGGCGTGANGTNQQESNLTPMQNNYNTRYNNSKSIADFHAIIREN